MNNNTESIKQVYVTFLRHRKVPTELNIVRVDSRRSTQQKGAQDGKKKDRSRIG